MVDVQKGQLYVVWAALCALFLGALDALVMAAAMPTIVAELSGLNLYSWVYSAYFLARAVSLPMFGKIADMYGSRNIFIGSILLFLVASLVAGCTSSMVVLVAARAFQGIGSGGIFALVYIVLSHIAEPAQRGKMLSFASSVWGVASVVGPTLGGVIVTYMSWRWIFFLNVPIAMLSVWGVFTFFRPPRGEGRPGSIDWAGAVTLCLFILCFLLLFILTGNSGSWLNGQRLVLLAMSILALSAFIRIERKAENPVLDLRFFSKPGFALGNLAVFFASFAIFSLFAYTPLFIQGALDKRPIDVGLVMLSLSLGWSCGSLALGRLLGRIGERTAAIWGGMLLSLTGIFIVFFSTATSLSICFIVFMFTGLGMGFITLSTLLLVQKSVFAQDLGVATSFHQFSRTLGGTVGVGVCGGMVTVRLVTRITESIPGIDQSVLTALQESSENIFRPEFTTGLSAQALMAIKTAVAEAMLPVHVTVCTVSVLALLCVLFLRRNTE